jgi:anti-sigma regulatory factor (Ser/Thr protein kinase)
MTLATQAARTAAQLREAAHEMALVASRRRHDADMRAPVLPMSQQLDGLRIPPFAPHERGLTGRWRLRSFLDLDALDGAVPSARLHTRHALWAWGLNALLDDTELVVSELVTNGIQASRAMTHGAIRLWLLSDRAQVAVGIWDASPKPPVQADADDDAENGRGLLLVEAISTLWGWSPGGRTGTPKAEQGKVVWAVIGDSAHENVSGSPTPGFCGGSRHSMERP